VSALDAALLRALRASKTHVPPSELAAQLGTTHAALAAQIGELREAGFEFEEHPGLGYRLVAAPDRLIPGDLRARLGHCALVRDVIVFAETDSTNERAIELGRRGAESGLAIFAERQTAGRGRFGRRWESASHLGIWFSLLVRPTFPLGRWPRLTTWAAVAIANALGPSAGIKWPNDIFLGGRKAAGILIETGVDEAQRAFSVIGIGVNANHTAEDFPADLSARATSLRIETGRAVDRAALAAAILRELDARYSEIDRNFERLISEAMRRSVLLGRWVQARSGDGAMEGIAESLDAHGQLRLRKADGTIETLIAGEVTMSEERGVRL
jgi:BirA family biotin operon repressor/biotin-[acetyl-CoA-carboxylase] ligase